MWLGKHSWSSVAKKKNQSTCIVFWGKGHGRLKNETDEIRGWLGETHCRNIYESMRYNIEQIINKNTILSVPMHWIN